uniref:Uncharacterized protein n=1 Tax=Sphaerodactylus townsendi TaxID=933632 RepID=A0ACB8E8M3_9SAUR
MRKDKLIMKQEKEIALADEGGENEDSDEENDIAQGNCEEESNKSNKSGSEDEMKEADESTGSGDGPAKSVRKRRVRKD